MTMIAVDGEAVTISLERAVDVAARDALLARAMGANWTARTSHRLRACRLPAEGLALAAHDRAGTLVGTVRLWNIAADVDRDGHAVPALILGPLAVDPVRKGGGVGAALMRHAIAQATRLGHAAILLVGDAPYYERFGFSAAATTTLVLPGPVERERFLALELAEGALDGTAGMVVATGRRDTGSRAFLHFTA
ncbi:GNAT family N-acetyltransferase [Oricola sp.]|uniref:GNAT family N-acetyltransferase n=1 Tax=Oricola sp. TaxID=1979950 RepID=UPI003BA98129